MEFITKGRAKAIITHDAAFKPMVLVNISTPKPRRKDEISIIPLETLNGSKRIKYT